jgi:hypothetical protein
MSFDVLNCGLICTGCIWGAPKPLHPTSFKFRALFFILPAINVQMNVFYFHVSRLFSSFAFPWISAEQESPDGDASDALSFNVYRAVEVPCHQHQVAAFQLI